MHFRRIRMKTKTFPLLVAALLALPSSMGLAQERPDEAVSPLQCTAEISAGGTEYCLFFWWTLASEKVDGELVQANQMSPT